MTFEDGSNLITSTDTRHFQNPEKGSNANVYSKSFNLWCYIYLDTCRKSRFAQVSHEYLIEQLQYSAKIQLIQHLHLLILISIILLKN